MHKVTSQRGNTTKRQSLTPGPSAGECGVHLDSAITAGGPGATRGTSTSLPVHPPPCLFLVGRGCVSVPGPKTPCCV